MFTIYFSIKVVSAGLFAFAAARMLAGPIRKILQRFVPVDIVRAWMSCIRFVLIVVGVSGGVRLYELANHLNPRTAEMSLSAMTGNHWLFELYGTAVGTLQSIVWVLLGLLFAALIGYAVVRVPEVWRGISRSPEPGKSEFAAR